MKDERSDCGCLATALSMAIRCAMILPFLKSLMMMALNAAVLMLLIRDSSQVGA